MTDTPINLTGAMLPVQREGTSNRTELREVAQQFEAVLLRQMLSSARNADFGGDDLFGGQGADTFREMRDSQFADMAASSGQIGFGAAIESQLERFLPPGNS